MLENRRPLTLFVLLTLTVALLTPLLSPGAVAQQRTQAEIDAYRAMTALEDPHARIEAVEAFFAQWPESGYRTAVCQVGMMAAAEIDPRGEQVLEYADRYIDAYSTRSPRPLALAYAARQLEAAGSHPDRVDAWVAEALAGEADINPRYAVGIWDATAFIAHARGEYELAVERQRHVLEMRPSASADVTLAGYLIDTGELGEAEELIAGAILTMPDNASARSAFDELAARRTSGSAGAIAYKERLLTRQAEAMLAETDDELRVKQTLTVAFVKLGILLDEAARYAAELDTAVGPDAGADAYLAARTAVAQVHLARGDYETVLAVTDEVQQLASPYSYDFHLARGAALEALDRDDEAIEAYLESAGMVANPAVMEPLRAAWERVHGTLEGLEERRAEIAGALEHWHPEGTFTPPADWSGRVVLAELFTGSECPPCVGADVAFDGLIAYYPTDAVAVLVHHEHIPRPDPMTNPDTVDRMDYYGRGVVRGTPTVIINGTDFTVGGGSRAGGKGKFNTYSWMIDQHLTGEPPVDISLSGRLNGPVLEVNSRVQVLDRELRDRDDLRLRLAVAEEVVDFTGSNGVAEHRMVVRGYIGGAEGMALRQGKKTTRGNDSWDIAARETELRNYLETYQAENPGNFAGDGFTELTHEIDENRLLIVAFVQNDTTKEIYQARVLDLR